MTESNKQSQPNPSRSAPPEARGAHDEHASSKGGGVATEDAPSAEQQLVVFSGAVDIYPRPPLDPSNYGLLDLSSAGGTEFLPGLPGDIVDTSLKDQFSLIPETDIPFSFVVAYGSDQYCKLATAAGDKPCGVAARDTTAPSQVISALVVPYYGYRAYEWAVRIVRVGRMWALPTTPVHRGDPVSFDATGALGTGGLVPLPGAHWMSDASVGDLAMVNLNLAEVTRFDNAAHCRMAKTVEKRSQ